MRLFVAFDLPPEIAAELRRICQGPPAARWSAFGQLHLTLRFLGETPEDRLSEVRAALGTVAAAAFSARVRGVGVFPRKRGPARVLWAGLTPEEPTCALKAAIDKALGPDAEAAERGFSPHLTLARFREDPGPALARYLAEHAAFASAPFAVGAFHLYESTLGRDGAVHEVLESYPLVAPVAGG